jgi:ABC-type multidrug transport system permease subunit
MYNTETLTGISVDPSSFSPLWHGVHVESVHLSASKNTAFSFFLSFFLFFFFFFFFCFGFCNREIVYGRKASLYFHFHFIISLCINNGVQRGGLGAGHQNVAYLLVAGHFLAKD